MPDLSPSNQLLREPTLHFVAIAILVFIVYGLLGTDDGKVLELDGREIEARLFLAELSAGRELTEEQQQSLVNAYVEEQLLVAEALAMNLDNDARIHDILAQKMRHVLSADVIQPSAEELEAFYAANQERYRRAATVTLDELVFNTREELDDSLLGQLQAGAEPTALLALSPGTVTDLAGATQLDLANIFAEDFATEVFSASPGEWTGPFVSNRGQHWLRIRSRQESRVPTLSEISERVRLEWIASEEEARLQDKINALRDEYSIIVLEGEAEE